MSFSISIKKFRAAVDQIEDLRTSSLIKIAYLLAARNSELLTKTCPWDLLHGASKPYGSFLKFEFKDFEVSPATETKEAVMEKVFVVTVAVAKRGKRMQQPKEETTLELKEEEVIEAFTKYNQTQVIDRWRAGEIKIDPLLVKALLGKVTLKVVALPTNRQYEPWTLDALKWIQKNKGKLSFDLTRFRLWQLLRENLSSILPKTSKTTPKNPLRHFRISHLIEYYQFDAYQVTSYVGWKIGSTFAQMGIAASPNIDAYAHLQWRLYFPKLLKPIAKLK